MDQVYLPDSCCNNPDILHCKLGGDSGAPTGDYCVNCGRNSADHTATLPIKLLNALRELADKMRR